MTVLLTLTFNHLKSQKEVKKGFKENEIGSNLLGFEGNVAMRLAKEVAMIMGINTLTLERWYES